MKTWVNKGKLRQASNGELGVSARMIKAWLRGWRKVEGISYREVQFRVLTLNLSRWAKETQTEISEESLQARKKYYFTNDERSVLYLRDHFFFGRLFRKLSCGINKKRGYLIGWGTALSDYAFFGVGRNDPNYYCFFLGFTFQPHNTKKG